MNGNIDVRNGRHGERPSLRNFMELKLWGELEAQCKLPTQKIIPEIARKTKGIRK